MHLLVRRERSSQSFVLILKLAGLAGVLAREQGQGSVFSSFPVSSCDLSSGRWKEAIQSVRLKIIFLSYI